MLGASTGARYGIIKKAEGAVNVGKLNMVNLPWVVQQKLLTSKNKKMGLNKRNLPGGSSGGFCRFAVASR